MAYANHKQNSGKNLTFVPVAQGAAGATELVAAVSGKKHKVVSAALAVDATGTLKFNDGSSDLTGAYPISQYGGFVLPPGVSHWFETASGSALNLTTGVSKAFGVVAVVTE